jgi:hypothetical protein
MPAITCEHCINMKKDPVIGLWGCELPEVPPGKLVNDTCREWRCAACGRGANETNLRFDGGERFEDPITHDNCWPEVQEGA